MLFPTLQAHSHPLMAFIGWRPTPDRNVEVLNDTSDLYRYFNCAGAASFSMPVYWRTVQQDLPREIDYLRPHDEALGRVMEAVETRLVMAPIGHRPHLVAPGIVLNDSDLALCRLANRKGGSGFLRRSH